MIKKIVIYILVLSVCHGLELPSYFKKCKKSDPALSKCVKESLEGGWKRFSEGDSTYHISGLNPIHVDYLFLRVDAKLFGNFTNAIITGFPDTQFRDVQVDLEKMRFDFRYRVPLISIKGNYAITGSLVGIPINGNGNTTMEMYNGIYHYYFTYNLQQKKGKQYINITDSNSEYEEIEKMKFQVDFLSKPIADALNDALNESWRDLDKSVIDTIGLAFGQIMEKVLKAFFKKVSYDDFFEQE